MKREAFLQFLVTKFRGPFTNLPLPAKSAPSYASYVAIAERMLDQVIDDLDLSEAGLVGILSRLRSLAAGGALSTKMVSNCGSALRAYAQFALALPDNNNISIGTTRRVVPRAARANRIPAAAPVRDPLVAHLSVKGLFAMHGAILDELRERGLVRTSNAPSGDYAETLFKRAFGWKLESNSALGFDAIDGGGARYQIKCRRLTRFNASRQLSAIRRLPEKSFDYLAAILFNETYGVARAIILPHQLVETRAKYTEHTNSWRFLLDDKIWQLDGVRDVTDEVALAADGI